MKVMTILGTRPEIIRLSVLIKILDSNVEHVLVHTGQNFDSNLSDIFFEDLDLRKPDYFLNSPGSSFGSSIANLFSAAEPVIQAENPDAICILGDTNSALLAILAERMGIPVYHMEAGNRSFDPNVPEELNRRIVDHASSFNLPYNEFSRRNLLSEGLEPRMVLTTGSPLPEVVKTYERKILDSTITSELGLERGKYLVLSAHRQETVDHPRRLTTLLDAVEGVSESLGMPVAFSVHPRTRSKLDQMDVKSSNIKFLEPLSYTGYCRLQKDSYCVLSDSGTVSEEAFLLDFPAVTIRESIERPEALETGAVLLGGISLETVSRAVNFARASSVKNHSVPDGYDVHDFSRRVLSIILSTSHVHRKWAGLNPLD
ncbi:MAG: hypothetical protein RIS08_1025 [Actinomycetota bacterium]|jgi:UDP-N-acetylglucosamine 2-epimerase (non-hydrolysing)